MLVIFAWLGVMVYALVQGHIDYEREKAKLEEAARIKAEKKAKKATPPKQS